MPRTASGDNIPDGEEGHGVGQTAVGSPLILGVGCAWLCPHALACSTGCRRRLGAGRLALTESEAQGAVLPHCARSCRKRRLDTEG